MSRPEFGRLRRDNFAGYVKTVVVFRVDRIARRLREGLDLLCDWCERGVRVVSVTQQVDVSGTMGRMVAALMLGLAEIEWEYRRDRQAAGIAVARDYDGGEITGRKRPLIVDTSGLLPVVPVPPAAPRAESYN